MRETGTITLQDRNSTLEQSFDQSVMHWFARNVGQVKQTTEAGGVLKPETYELTTGIVKGVNIPSNALGKPALRPERFGCVAALRRQVLGDGGARAGLRKPGVDGLHLVVVDPHGCLGSAQP